MLIKLNIINYLFCHERNNISRVLSMTQQRRGRRDIKKSLFLTKGKREKRTQK